MIKCLIIIPSIVLVLLVISCSEDNNNPFDSIRVVSIYSVSPDSASVGEVITIIGTNFGTSSSKSYISFGITKASEYINWSNSEIKVKVPLITKGGKVFVIVNGVKSNEVDFTIKPSYSGSYEIVYIGNQIWMKKNLNVENYRNGDSIPQVTNKEIWDTLKTGAWCYYNNDPQNGDIYGKLYNWYAVRDPRGLAPAGWHIPDNFEFRELKLYLGDTYAGGKLKTTGTLEGGDGLWHSPNEGATNESDFSAVPGGIRAVTFENIASYCFLWSESEYMSIFAPYWRISFDDVFFGNSYIGENCGLSVRCVKD